MVQRLFLQQGQGTRRVQVLGTSNHDNRTNIVAQPINEASNEIEFIGVGIVDFELLIEISEFLDVLRDRGIVLNVEQLAKQELMLISAESLVDQGSEGVPRDILDFRQLIERNTPGVTSRLTPHLKAERN
jgi:hypothetical protein